jgi:predicted benzoate:H+ symporter BenE
MEWYPWLVFLHVLGGFTFVLAHGASAMGAFRLRRERQPARVAALLDLSSFSIGLAYIGLLVILVSGVLALDLRQRGEG